MNHQEKIADLERRLAKYESARPDSQECVEAFKMDVPDVPRYGRLDDGSWGPDGIFWTPRPGTAEMAVRVLALNLRAALVREAEKDNVIAELRRDLDMAHRVVENHKAEAVNAVRIGCENITRAEKAEDELAAMTEERDEYRGMYRYLKAQANGGIK